MLNLWAEFDNEQSPAESAGRTQNHRVSRRPTEQAILASLRDWLLHDYILLYSRSLAPSRILRTSCAALSAYRDGRRQSLHCTQTGCASTTTTSACRRGNGGLHVPGAK